MRGKLVLVVPYLKVVTSNVPITQSLLNQMLCMQVVMSLSNFSRWCLNSPFLWSCDTNGFDHWLYSTEIGQFLLQRHHIIHDFHNTKKWSTNFCLALMQTRKQQIVYWEIVAETRRTNRRRHDCFLKQVRCAAAYGFFPFNFPCCLLGIWLCMAIQGGGV